MHELVKDYYGRQLQSTGDLRTSACCDASQMPEWLKPLLARIHPEVMSRYYGCGLVSPPSIATSSIAPMQGLGLAVEYTGRIANAPSPLA